MKQVREANVVVEQNVFCVASRSDSARRTGYMTSIPPHWFLPIVHSSLTYSIPFHSIPFLRISFLCHSNSAYSMHGFPFPRLPSLRVPFSPISFIHAYSVQCFTYIPFLSYLYIQCNSCNSIPLLYLNSVPFIPISSPRLTFRSIPFIHFPFHCLPIRFHFYLCRNRIPFPQCYKTATYRPIYTRDCIYQPNWVRIVHVFFLSMYWYSSS